MSVIYESNIDYHGKKCVLSVVVKTYKNTNGNHVEVKHNIRIEDGDDIWRLDNVTPQLVLNYLPELRDVYSIANATSNGMPFIVKHGFTTAGITDFDLLLNLRINEDELEKVVNMTPNEKASWRDKQLPRWKEEFDSIWAKYNNYSLAHGCFSQPILIRR